MTLVDNWPYGLYAALSFIGLVCLPFGTLSYTIGWVIIFTANSLALTRYIHEQCSKKTVELTNVQAAS